MEPQPLIKSAKFNIVISWKQEPYRGKPLTRTWRGVDHTGQIHESRSGDTPEMRDREIQALKRDNARFGHDWTVQY